MRIALLAALAACGGAPPRSPLGHELPRAPVPIVALERVALGDPPDRILAAFPAAQRHDDELFVDGIVVEGQPAAVSFYLEAGRLRRVLVNFGEICGDFAEVKKGLEFRLGASVQDRDQLAPSWRHGPWQLWLSCHSADTMAWLGLTAAEPAP